MVHALIHMHIHCIIHVYASPLAYKSYPFPTSYVCIPYSAYISRVFNFADFVNLESFAKLFQRKSKTVIHENFDPRNISAIWYMYVCMYTSHACSKLNERISQIFSLYQ